MSYSGSRRSSLLQKRRPSNRHVAKVRERMFRYFFRLQAPLRIDSFAIAP
jgi:hypothetical protein